MEGVKFEEELRAGDSVAGSWVKVERVPGLEESQAGNIYPSDDDNSKKELWVGGGIAVSWARVGCVTILVGCRSGSDCPSVDDSLAHILTSSSSERLGFFRANEMSFKGNTGWGGSFSSVFLGGGG